MSSPGTGLALDPQERDLIRSLIVADPELVLADDQVMRALIGDTEANGRQVVDLRDRLVERLETRLKKLMDTNRSVIAAAYETVSGTRQLHRAILALLEARDLTGFLRCLTATVPGILGVAEARLCLEADVEDTRPAAGLGEGLEGRVLAMPEGTVDDYLLLDGMPTGTGIVLREAGVEAELLFGARTSVRSEALTRLDLDGAIGLMAFGSEDPDRFAPDHGTDLLAFFAEVVQRLLLHRLEAEKG